MEETETIAAIATAPGTAGISIIRVSGENAVPALEQIFQPKKKELRLKEVTSHTVHYGYIVDDGNMMDEVLVLVMKAPNTYTREDVVEIDCHGGIAVTRRVLETVLKHGVRAAEPGEFTKRAFLNGRIDLSQAEAVMDLINSRNAYALQSSLQQLSGRMRKKIETIREKVLRDVALIEAALDDPEHIELDGFSEELSVHVREETKELEKLLASAENGRILKEGVRTVILGKPNAGKSSLLNLLAGSERAIVTETAGTTRDILEETVNLSGISLILMDTAGIRQTNDQVEKIGVERAKQAVTEADLILFVLDSSRPLSKEDLEIAALVKGKPTIILWNKTDLPPAFSKEDFPEGKDSIWIPLSVKEETGLSELTKQIRNLFYEGKISFNDEVYLTNARHQQAVSSALKSLHSVEESIERGMPEDFFSIDLMDCYESLGKILGESLEEDLVNKIFSEFCMGK